MSIANAPTAAYCRRESQKTDGLYHRSFEADRHSTHTYTLQVEVLLRLVNFCDWLSTKREARSQLQFDWLFIMRLDESMNEGLICKSMVRSDASRMTT